MLWSHKCATSRRGGHSIDRFGRYRWGAATVELAVCLPLLATIVFGSIQACNMLYFRHALLSSAYQGSLAAAHPGATTASITQSVQNMLSARCVTGATIIVEHWNNGSGVLMPPGSDYADFPRNTKFTIQVVAPLQPNLMEPHWFVPPSQVAVEVTSLK